MLTLTELDLIKCLAIFNYYKSTVVFNSINILFADSNNRVKLSANETSGIDVGFWLEMYLLLVLQFLVQRLALKLT